MVLVKRSMKKIIKLKHIICVVLFVVPCVIILQSDWSPDLYYLTLKTFDDVSCHYSLTNDNLPAISENFSPPENTIHFHETSCRGSLNSRQACAVESAARVHPDRQVNLYFTGPVSKENLHTASFEALKKYDNIKIMRLHLINYAKGTPLEDLVSGGALNRTRWRISHTSDVLRYLTLYKWGGVYLDLDVVVVRSFEELAPNWAARESNTSVSSGALCFSRDALGREMANEAVSDLKKNYRGDIWERNGPQVITRILRKICSTEYLTEMSATTCKGVEVYGPELFYPVSWRNADEYFEDKDLNVKTPYSYHVWNKFTESYKVNENSVYAKLARKHCPVVYEAFGENFGL